MRWMSSATMGAFAGLLLMSTAAQAFNDPPSLADDVASGALPPIDERLPDEPQVWADNEWNSVVGKYGGQIRVTTHHFIQAMAQVGFARITSDRREFVPDLAKSFEWNEDKSAITFHMREGVRRSDGEPFTADDICSGGRRYPVGVQRSAPARLARQSHQSCCQDRRLHRPF